MSSQESKRPGRPEARVLKIDLPVKESGRQRFDYGLPRKRWKGTMSESGEEFQDRHQDETRSAGAHRNRPRWARP